MLKDKKSIKKLFEKSFYFFYNKSDNKENIFDGNSDIGWYIKKEGLEKNPRTFDYFYISNNKLVLKRRPLSREERRLLILFFEYLKDIPFNKDELYKLFNLFCSEHLIKLDNEQRDYFLKIIEEELFGYSCLSDFIKSNFLEEIAIIDVNKAVYVFVKGDKWYESNLYISNDSFLKELINKLSYESGRRITHSKPLMNSSLKDGSRMNAVIKPITKSSAALTIRRFSSKALSPYDLLSYTSISLEEMAFLSLFMQTDSNIMVIGNTGSGKTTLLNALFYFVSPDDRIIIAEETSEIRLPHKHKVSLLVNEEKNIKMIDLIKNTLRMRPDRIIIGEIRTEEELKAYIDTILAGQGKGSYASFHGYSIKDAISRLYSMGLKKNDISAIDLILFQKRWTSICEGKRIENRKLVEIASSDGNAFFKYNYNKESFDFLRPPKYIKDKIELVFSKDFDYLMDQSIDFFRSNALKGKNAFEFNIEYNNFLLGL